MVVDEMCLCDFSFNRFVLLFEVSLRNISCFENYSVQILRSSSKSNFLLVVGSFNTIVEKLNHFITNYIVLTQTKFPSIRNEVKKTKLLKI